MRTLNLGIVAHVDAGKTSLTERLLYAAGVIDEVGRVDHGNTQTDSLALERQRGITIKAAVVSFVIDDVTVNLIDTPGHPDFVAEVERALGVLDGAILVISAVEGVQARTRVLMGALRRLRIPTLIFVNKVDRRGARQADLIRAIKAGLTSTAVPMGHVDELGTKDARYTPSLPPRIVDLLADHDDDLLAAYVADEAAASYGRLCAALATQTRRARVHPVFFGSAVTGAGIDALTRGVRDLLPGMAGDATGPASGTVFKVERGPAGEKIAYVRMFRGAVRVRDRLAYGKVTAAAVFDHGQAVRCDEVVAGRIGKLWGLAGVRIGDPVGEPPRSTVDRGFAPPTLETIVEAVDPTRKGALHAALAQLAEQDPLIDLRQDDLRQEISVSLYGEVQKEVIGATLADEYGLAVTFRETTTICVERVVGTGEAVELIGKEPNPFLGTVGLRVEPAAAGSGVEFRLGVELDSMPYAFIKAVEDTVHETLHQGVYGWRVPDCVVTLTRSGYWA